MLATPKIRAWRPGDEAAILRAAERVFGRVDAAWRGRTLESWRWRFQDSPAGGRVALALDEQGEVRAQYAGIRQRVVGAFAPATFAQAVDSFDVRRVEGGLARQSGFVRAGEFYAREFCGEGQDQDQVVWGLSIPPAWRIGAARLEYEHVRTVTSLAARLEELEAAPAAGLVVEESETAPADVEALFLEVAAERGAIAVKDRAVLDWRFARHPEHRYRFGAVRAAAAPSSSGSSGSSGSPGSPGSPGLPSSPSSPSSPGALRALGVWRVGSFAGEQGGLVCEWLVPSTDVDAAATLLAWFAERTRAAGERQLVALFADTSPEWLELQRRGFRVLPTDYVLAARTFRAPFDRDFLFWRWCYTLGDTDLV